MYPNLHLGEEILPLFRGPWSTVESLNDADQEILLKSGKICFLQLIIFLLFRHLAPQQIKGNTSPGICQIKTLF
jgi:hypothetical protein